MREYREQDEFERVASTPELAFDGWDELPPIDASASVTGEAAESASTQTINEARVEVARAFRSTEDAAAIESYTGSGYADLNRALRQGTIAEIEIVAADSNQLSEALGKYPLHEGTVFRGSTTDLPQEVIDGYEPGEIIVENTYLSTSRDAEREFGGNVLWVIESNDGRDISSSSRYASEQEVLLDRFSKFEILAKDYDPYAERWIVYMRQL